MLAFLTLYVAGRVGRGVEDHFFIKYGERVPLRIVPVHFLMPPAWQPTGRGHVFPCPPMIGDVFIMEAIYDEDEEDDVFERSYETWQVKERHLHTSGPGAVTMTGIITLVIDRVQLDEDGRLIGSV